MFCNVPQREVIYPTQSSELIHEERVDEYIQIMKNGSNPPRGLAYYEKGFVCALLDGHHKACAASALGKRLNCLTIIAPDSFRFAKGAKYADGDTLIEKVGFASLMVDTKPGAKMKDYVPVKGVKQKEINIPVYNLTGRKLPERYISTYPTIQTLARVINAEVDINGAYYRSKVNTRFDAGVFILVMEMRKCLLFNVFLVARKLQHLPQLHLKSLRRAPWES